MKLDYLLKGLNMVEISGKRDIDVKGVTNDSRAVKEGYLFVAVKGSSHDGHRYLAQAIERGAHVLIAEHVEKEFKNTTIVRVPDTKAARDELAVQFYRYPAEGMNLIGITGTNGKTTTSYLLESILREAGIKAGVIGTINYRFNGKSFDASLTTPDYMELMRIIREMRDTGVTDIIIEVSSHSLDQGRTKGLHWSRALFTNFSRDHLDYHATMDEYFKAKSLLFTSLQENQRGNQAKAVINIDDPKGKMLQEITKVPVVSYGLGDNCMVRALDIESTLDGLQFRLATPSGDLPVVSSLLGQINVYNILSAAATAYSVNIGERTISEGIEKLAYVPGRLQRVNSKRGLSVFVDYAHSPEALEKVLQTLSPFTKGRLITVFGCGGERDRGKRPEMGKVAGRHSDLVLITSDNPRRESPTEIVYEIEPGVREAGLKRIDSGSSLKGKGYDIILDRREAIKRAIHAATKEDIVIIAGKGHETYQLFGNRKRYFNDLEEAAKAASE
jgi:UDP-N-acetylmuramoyl-L-alanyl-D-glutamate--2,6-diaminopimelate ligase